MPSLEFKALPYNMDNLVHNFVQNLGCKTKPIYRRKIQKIKYISYIDRAHKMKKNMLPISNKVREILVHDNLDFCDMQNIQLSIRKRTNFHDQLYRSNVPFLCYVLRNINKKITQKIITAKTQSKWILKKSFIDHCKKNLLVYEHSSNDDDALTYKVNAESTSAITMSNAGKQCSFIKLLTERKNAKYVAKNNFEEKQREHSQWAQLSIGNIDECNLTANVMQYIKRETELNQRYLQLQSKRSSFIKKNLQVALYITAKSVGTNNFKVIVPKHQQVLSLCKQAVLSLIEPSNKVTVLYKDDFFMLIQYHLMRGYKYHFNLQFNVEDDYQALLVLSYWAGSLVKHPNTTLIRTISCILTCSPHKILVLSYPTEHLNKSNHI